MFIAPDKIEVENGIVDLNLFNIVGSWKDNFMDISYHLVKDNEGYSLVKEFDDGSFHEINVTYEDCSNKCIFSIENSSADELFVLSSGTLELRDSQGYIDKFMPISRLL